MGTTAAGVLDGHGAERVAEVILAVLLWVWLLPDLDWAMLVVVACVLMPIDRNVG
ncbi:hypothetical protein [Mycolicibacterium sp. P9-64]|uniref:hypothetical protein n=1 Tax=Mycolicibacterium sp. P9-64 TaxID=2024612 RepID=UPI0015651E4D|nr:hypothetical protein [Mycolicibacterium sp. P9-64]